MNTKRHYMKLTPSQREELIEQIQAGVDWDTLMANFRVSRSTIYFYKDKIYGKNPAGKVKKKYRRHKKSAKAATVAAAARMGMWKVEEASGSNQEMVRLFCSVFLLTAVITTVHDMIIILGVRR